MKKKIPPKIYLIYDGMSTPRADWRTEKINDDDEAYLPEATRDRTAIRLNWQLKHQFEELLKHYNKRLRSDDLSKEATKDYAECAETLKDILSRADA